MDRLSGFYSHSAATRSLAQSTATPAVRPASSSFALAANIVSASSASVKPAAPGLDTSTVERTQEKLRHLSHRRGARCFTLRTSNQNNAWFVVAANEKDVHAALPSLVGMIGFQQSLHPRDLVGACDAVHRAMAVQGLTDGMLYANLHHSAGITTREGGSIGPHFIGNRTTPTHDIYVDLTAKNILFKNKDQSFVYEGLIVIDAVGSRNIVDGIYDCQWEKEDVDPEDGYSRAMTQDLLRHYGLNTTQLMQSADELIVSPAPFENPPA